MGRKPPEGTAIKADKEQLDDVRVVIDIHFSFDIDISIRLSILQYHKITLISYYQHSQLEMEPLDTGVYLSSHCETIYL